MHGAADDIGKYTVEDPVEVHDLLATVLPQMGRKRLNPMASDRMRIAKKALLCLASNLIFTPLRLICFESAPDLLSSK